MWSYSVIIITPRDLYDFQILSKLIITATNTVRKEKQKRNKKKYLHRVPLDAYGHNDDYDVPFDGLALHSTHLKPP